MEGRL